MTSQDHQALECTLFQISILLGFQGEINEIVVSYMDRILYSNLGADFEIDDDEHLGDIL